MSSSIRLGVNYTFQLSSRIYFWQCRWVHCTCWSVTSVWESAALCIPLYDLLSVPVIRACCSSQVIKPSCKLIKTSQSIIHVKYNKISLIASLAVHVLCGGPRHHHHAHLSVSRGSHHMHFCSRWDDNFLNIQELSRIEGECFVMRNDISNATSTLGWFGVITSCNIWLETAY